MSDANKVCPLCLESIKAQAKLCPHCRQWLSFRSLRNPAVSVVILGIWASSVLALLIFAGQSVMNTLAYPKPHYTSFLDSIQVQESKMQWNDTSEGLRIALTGVLTNKSSEAWRDPEFECRFFDQKGSFIDAAPVKAYMAIRGNDTAGFRLTLKPLLSTNNYATYTLRVNMARTTKSFF